MKTKQKPITTKQKWGLALVIPLIIISIVILALEIGWSIYQAFWKGDFVVFGLFVFIGLFILGTKLLYDE